MPTTAVKQKWFWPLQKTMGERFDQMYPNRARTCMFQVVTKDRIIEQWQIFPDPDKASPINQEATTIALVHMIKRGKDSHTLLMYEMKFVASN